MTLISKRNTLYGKEPGAWSLKLYDKLLAIQNGDEPDPYGWDSGSGIIKDTTGLSGTDENQLLTFQ
jgi:hypothetical protein